MTPVPTVAMDCGLLESRLDRLDNPGAGLCLTHRAKWFEPGGSNPMVRLSERT